MWFCERSAKSKRKRILERFVSVKPLLLTKMNGELKNDRKGAVKAKKPQVRIA